MTRPPAMLALALALAACSGSGTGLVANDGGRVIGDSGSDITGAPISPGDTITAAADRVELAGDPMAAIAVWTSPDEIAHAAVVGFEAEQVGTTLAFPQAQVVDVHALSLAGGTQLAVGIVTAEPAFYVATVGDDGTAGAPIALVTPTANCQFAVPDKLLCATADARFVLGTIAPDSGAIAFGGAHALPAAAFGLRSGGEALLFTDAAGCSKLVDVADTDDFGDAQPIACPSAPQVLRAATAIEPMPTMESAFARAYVAVDADATHRECAFYAIDAGLHATPTAAATDDHCPDAITWGQGQLFGITLGANGTAAMTTYFVDGTEAQPPDPLLGIGGLKAVDITTGAGAFAVMATSDGERIQFAVFDGVPI